LKSLRYPVAMQCAAVLTPNGTGRAPIRHSPTVSEGSRSHHPAVFFEKKLAGFLDIG